MASLKALKLRIGSVKSTQKITKAMNMVAAAKLRRAQQNAEAGAALFGADDRRRQSLASRITAGPQSPKLLAGTGKDDTHLISSRPPTGPRRRVQQQHRSRRAPQGGRAGRAGQDGPVLHRRPQGPPGIQRLYPKAIIAQYDTSEMKAPTYADAQAIAKDIVDRYMTDGIDVVHLAYANFRSTLVQEPTVEQIIPVAPRAARSAAAPQGGAPAAVEYEPDEEEILADLLPRNIAVQIYRALLENQAGFYGSQMTAMDNATRNAGDMIKRLSIQYNRQRQAVITTELIEIISGAEAL